jgi:tRNA nucleotidyltransferase (CCA-adding enzyme)
LLLALRCGLVQGWHADAAAAPALSALSLEQAQRRGLRDAELAWALPLARLSALLLPEALITLRSSRKLQQRCRALRRWRRDLASAGGWSALAEPRRLELHRDLEDDLPALLLLVPDPPGDLLERWRNPHDGLLHPRPPLDGRQLQQQLGIPAGPVLGQLLDHLTLERAFGRLGDGPEECPAALAAAKRWWVQRKGSDGLDSRRD